MNKRILHAALLCLGTAMLAGCAAGGGSTTHHHYTLQNTAITSPSASQAHGRTAGQAGHDVLQVAHITVPQWLSGTAMYYWLAYKDGSRLSAYAYSEWAEPPAQLLGVVIRHALAADGHWRAVIGPDTSAAADQSLHLHLKRFGQVFSKEDQSTAVIEVTATLVETDNDRVAAQKAFQVSVAAQSPNAQGGAQALSKAARKLAVELQEWLDGR